MAYILEAFTSATAMTDPGILMTTCWVGGGLLVMAAATATVKLRAARPAEVSAD